MNKYGAAKKKARNLLCVKARHDFLVEGIQSPNSVSAKIAVALVSQRAFAALNIPEVKIFPISLNTLKNLADELYTGTFEGGDSGFAYLDSLRLNLRNLVEISRDKKAVDNSEIQNARLEELLNKIRLIEFQNILQSKALQDLYGKILRLAKDGEMEQVTRLRLLRIIENHQVLFKSLYAPEATEARNDASNLTLIPGGRE